jgi:hypothetical protein
MASIKNWAKFQHFKDRRPPWVKLYRDLLDDIEWHELDAQAAKVLVMLWLIASEDDGNIPDTKKLAFRLRTTENKTSELLSKLSHWLNQDDIAPISEGHQSDAPETEEERETEKRQKPARKCPESFVLTSEMREWAAKEAPGVDVDREFAKLRDHTFATAKTDWPATWRNWIREAFDRVKARPGALKSVTVPGKPGRDPYLEKMDADDRNAAPIPLDQLERMAKIRKGVH